MLKVCSSPQPHVFTWAIWFQIQKLNIDKSPLAKKTLWNLNYTMSYTMRYVKTHSLKPNNLLYQIRYLNLKIYVVRVDRDK